MAVTTNNRFKFVSPGVSIQEIDNSQIPATPAQIGPVIIGRTQRGPAMIPVTINSFSDFVEIFGNPVPGGQGGDVWRDGNMTSPMYAAYAAQAWLKNSNSATIVRLLGHQSPNKSTAGTAGWSANGAYGVFVFSGSTNLTGTLAAVLYTNSGTSIYATGGQTINGTLPAPAGTASFCKPDSNGNFSLVVSSSTTNAPMSFNFNQTSPYFIRKVLNCNPVSTNSNVSNTVIPYFLGESFEEYVKDSIFTSPIIQNSASVAILPLTTNSYKKSATDSYSYTPFVFGQDLGPAPLFTGSNLQNLFRFADLYSGESTQKNFKISIQDIKPAQNPTIDPYGTFTVVVRKADDNDAATKIVEKYVNLNLNPASANYIAAVIGDQYLEWSEDDRNYRLKGDFANNSKFIRVEMNTEVANGVTPPALLPFGFFSAPKFKTASSTGAAVPTSSIFASATLSGSSPAFTVQFPELLMRTSSSQGNLSSQTNAYFGVTYTKSDFVTPYSGFSDLIRTTADGVTNSMLTSTPFTLDDIVLNSGSYVVQSGARHDGLSITALYGSSYLLETAKINRFTVPMYGGFDGLDITEMDPFNDRVLRAATGDKNVSCSPFYSISKAIAAVSDPERVEMNLIAAPGITDAGITGQMVDLCEARADALAVIDIPNIYVPRAESTSNGPQFSLDTCVSTFKARATNSSYACTYYPGVKVADTVNGNQVWVPPSVVMLGVFSNTDKKADPWFAPAGFTRGGLTEGAAGIPVVAVSEQLTAKQRDKLYDANINPIAQFPTEGIVVYGQKTLQVTKSALDRINVRRMLIYVKREISKISATTLFEPNVRDTWNTFSGRCTLVLSTVKTRLGLDDFKLVLDETTTTPDLVDRNIMYAKIYLKPTRAIEFIAVDFVITNSGASFED